MCLPGGAKREEPRLLMEKETPGVGAEATEQRVPRALTDALLCFVACRRQAGGGGCRVSFPWAPSLPTSCTGC